jgi:hypothetical protein
LEILTPNSAKFMAFFTLVSLGAQVERNGRIKPEMDAKG